MRIWVRIYNRINETMRMRWRSVSSFAFKVKFLLMIQVWGEEIDCKDMFVNQEKWSLVDLLNRSVWWLDVHNS